MSAVASEARGPGRQAPLVGRGRRSKQPGPEVAADQHEPAQLRTPSIPAAATAERAHVLRTRHDDEADSDEGAQGETPRQVCALLRNPGLPVLADVRGGASEPLRADLVLGRASPASTAGTPAPRRGCSPRPARRDPPRSGRSPRGTGAGGSTGGGAPTGRARSDPRRTPRCRRPLRSPRTARSPSARACACRSRPAALQTQLSAGTGLPVAGSIRLA